ncbi:MAG TPA: restriction endonuclease [Candidatus Brocadiia bacterium]|nr:restriction endonuclease [Candidatus Brocadiales bacterium]
MPPRPQPPQLLVVPQPPKETDGKYQIKEERIESSLKETSVECARRLHMTHLFNIKVVRLLQNDYLDKWMKQKDEEMLKKYEELNRRYQNVERLLESTKNLDYLKWLDQSREYFKQYENELKQLLETERLNSIDNAKRQFESDYNKWLKQKEEILKKNAELKRQYQDELKQWEAERQNRIDNAKRQFESDSNEWLKQKEEIPKKNAELEGQYQDELKRWELKNAELERQYQDEIKQWEQKNSELERQYQNELKQWEAEKQEFLKRQQERNDDIVDKAKEPYFNKLPDAIIDYCVIVLSKSEYPDYFPQEFDVDYNPETKILIVDYSLPSLDSIPKLKEVKYVKSRDESVEVFHAESFINKLYDSLVYQITLRTIYELYKFDVVNALDSIVFNGWVKSIDRATGQEVNACILSLQANRQEFLSINLANVDPKSCFKHLKGVGSSQLHSLTPVAPILNINREDKRFISSYAVADELDESMNLAAMDWEDFEHLIRELFEKEFAQYGGEVKVTQASRDGGVDAIAFDPDPIRGGKIAIQAKRYTNTVGLSAVRDLYGTVINEGATKGILITTADYGPDAYEFAKGKPLTLLNGSNLLHLLGKHGHRAKIDLKAAREILSEREKR